MRLIVVRHGETTYNVQRRYTGQSDVSLSVLGERQAERVGAYLAKEHLDVIVSSDLQRTHVMAQAIASYHSLPVQEDADLREISMGEWEGATYDEVVARNATVVARWRDDPTIYAAPGGENLIQLRDRIVRALERWQTDYPEATVVWVTHGGFIGVLICHLLDIDLNRRWQFHHDNASISEFRLSQTYMIFTCLNESSYLRTP